MALSPVGTDYQDIDGMFREKECKNHFEYSNKILSDWDKEHGFTHRIWVGPLGESRPATIKKTVAYVSVDIDENSNPIIEKWKIKHCWRRN
jgi:hypothetical protein